MAIGDVCKLHLENIALGADALGRFEGKSVFVEGGAPDETVICRITEEQKTWARAELLEIIEPSPVRVESKCTYYKKCGGCNFAHIDYAAQLKIKTSMLSETFVKTAGFLPPAPEVFASPPWGYRNRMQFHCLREKAKADSPKYGLKGRRSAEIIAVSDCPAAVSGIRKILGAANQLSLPPEKDRFTVFSYDDILLNEGGLQKSKIKLLDKDFFIDAGLFFQSNCFMLEKLILELRKTAQNADRNLPMADLYCGVGTFAVFLGELFPKVILAEENKAAISLARENLKKIAADYFTLHDTDWQRILFRQKTSFGFAVIDPPRAGLNYKLAEALARDGPPLLAYVSCDPASLARDSKILTGGGYKLKELKFFDFYPQTSHIESLAVFKR